MIAPTDTSADTLPATRRRGGGPRTEEGKARSRANALKHGLRAKTLVPEDLTAAVAARTVAFAREFLPRTAYEHWLVGEMALASTRLDRCVEMGFENLLRVADRASVCWEDDRRADVEELGARLGSDPSRVSRNLRRTRQGADWLIERWEGLGAVLRRKGGWDDDQRRLAHDLLGVPNELRDGGAAVPPADDLPALAALVEREIDRLMEEREAVLDELDEAERGMATAGMPLLEDAATIRLRRYEASCRRALNWAHAEWKRVRSETPAPRASSYSTAPASPPRPAAATIAARVVPPSPPPPPRVSEPIEARTPVVATASPRIAPAPFDAPPARNRRQRRALERAARQSASNR